MLSKLYKVKDSNQKGGNKSQTDSDNNSFKIGIVRNDI